MTPRPELWQIQRIVMSASDRDWRWSSHQGGRGWDQKHGVRPRLPRGLAEAAAPLRVAARHCGQSGSPSSRYQLDYFQITTSEVTMLWQWQYQCQCFSINLSESLAHSYISCKICYYHRICGYDLKCSMRCMRILWQVSLKDREKWEHVVRSKVIFLKRWYGEGLRLCQAGSMSRDSWMRPQRITENWA